VSKPKHRLEKIAEIRAKFNSDFYNIDNKLSKIDVDIFALLQEINLLDTEIEELRHGPFLDPQIKLQKILLAEACKNAGWVLAFIAEKIDSERDLEGFPSADFLEFPDLSLQQLTQVWDCLKILEVLWEVNNARHK
jgi:hypothetical protein